MQRRPRTLFVPTGYTFYPTIADLPPWLNRSDMEPRHCVSDEHYFPTLLAVLGLEDEVQSDTVILCMSVWCMCVYHSFVDTMYCIRRTAWGA